MILLECIWARTIPLFHTMKNGIQILSLLHLVLGTTICAEVISVF